MIRAETVASTVVHSTLPNPARTKPATENIVDSLRFTGTAIKQSVAVNTFTTEPSVDQLKFVLRRKFQQTSTVVVCAMAVKP